MEGYDPDAYLKAYRDAGSDVNELRRIHYAENRERINAQKRAAYADMFAEYSQEEMLIRREIDAQKYLISVAERYKIPIGETNVTKQNLANYEERLKERLNGKEGQKE